MNTIAKLWRKLFPVRIVTHRVKVFDAESSINPLKEMDEMLPMLVNAGNESADLMKYELLRLQALHDELFRCKQPESVDECVKYAMEVRSILSKQEEVRKMLSIPSRAIKAIERKEKGAK